MSVSSAPKSKLRLVREAHGVSRERVAYELDMALRTVWRHEQGTTPLRRIHVLGYANYFGVDPEELTTA